MRFAEALRRLDARQPEHMPGPSLERIREIAGLLDQPQLTYPSIHITGTNGKTTAARVAASVACAHGITVGLYTSPHLLSVTERLSVCGSDITEEEFAQEWEHLEPFLQLVDGRGFGEVTYFEAVTALAFLWFADKPVGLGVFEVGMGGTWDATNLVDGEVAVVTPIGMDHVAELGPTLEDIAGEKAGILKPGATAVFREQEPAAASILAGRAAEVGSTPRWEGQDWEVEERLLAVGGQAFRLRGLHATYDDLYLPLFGDYAVHNAAAGIVAMEALTGQPLHADTLREGLAVVQSPGRLEIVALEPSVILDGAHNPAGAAALAEAMRESFRWERLHLVLAVSANKDLAGICAALAPLADEAYVARNDSVRSADPAEVAATLGRPALRFASVAEALAAARAAAEPRDVVLVTGSLFTVADAKRALAAR
ncbi:MAG: bifunctional folylpolyglutamate synthase/dihydrofolate synthase [Actinobacteria bacterium]|nr:MAG: bifunctional folylpolyglutamate synthase/dihydrofolate synthase [Actinomycetota bacterium]